MQLVEEWRQALRWGSVQLAIVFGAIVGYVTSPEGLAQVRGLLTYVPENWRPLASVLIGITAAVIPTLARITKFGSKSDG